MGVIWEHTLKWDRSPWGPWCWHSFRAGDSEVTVEPYLFGEAAQGALGAYIVKAWRSPQHQPELGRDLGPAGALVVLHYWLAAFQGEPVTVRWIPKAEIIQWEGEGAAVLLFLVGSGYSMALQTYNQLKPLMVRKYGDVHESVRAPTLEERAAVEVVKGLTGDSEQ